MNRLIRSILKYLPLLFIIIVFLLQLPFFDADADFYLSTSRGPWTDEGLYTLQLRNFVNHHILNFTESDGLLKAPLFNVLLLPLFYLFGSNWILTRIFLTICVLSSFYVFTKQRILNKTMLLFISAVLLQYHVFHYTHLALCEMIAIAMMLLGFAFYIKSIKTKSDKHFVFACILVSTAALIKIIFLYFLIIIPLTMLIESIVNTEMRNKQTLKQFLTASGMGILFFILFISIWYFLNHDFFIKIIFGQSEITYGSSLKLIWERVVMNCNFYREDIYFQFNIYLFYLNLFFIIFLFLFRKKIQWQGYLTALIFSGCWLFIEILKLGNTYLPSRYLVSGIVANLLFSCVAVELLLTLIKKHAMKIVYVLTAAMFLYNIYFYILSHQRRLFELKQINAYLSQVDFGNHPLMGNWAASCSWQSNAYVKPLSKGFYEINTFNAYHPKAIIAETDEADSEKALISQGINLSSHADSSRTFKVNQWTLVVYWIKQ